MKTVALQINFGKLIYDVAWCLVSVIIEFFLFICCCEDQKKLNNVDELVITSERLDRRNVTECYESTHFPFITESEKLAEPICWCWSEAWKGKYDVGVCIELRVENEAFDSRLEMLLVREISAALSRRSYGFACREDLDNASRHVFNYCEIDFWYN